MASNEDGIRARRRLTNKLIAAHDAARLRPFLDPQINLITGDGSLIVGVDAVLAAFDGQFRDPSFVTYLRSPEAIAVDQEGARAAERGTWIATWRGAEGDVTLSGWYLAVWKKTVGQWVIESELFVSLA